MAADKRSLASTTMQFSAATLWNALTTPEKAPPSGRQRPWVHAWCALCALVGAGYLLLLFTTRAGPVGASPISPTESWLSAIPAALVPAFAAWIAWRNPWAASDLFQQQRGRIVAAIAALQLLANALTALLLLGAGDMAGLLFSTTLLLADSQMLWLARRGLVSLAGALQVSLIVTGVLSVAGSQPELAAFGTPMLIGLAVLMSGLLVKWWFSIVAAVVLPLASAALGAFGSSLSASLPQLLPVIVVQLIAGAIVALYARSLETALRGADARDAELSAASAALRGQNAALQRQTSKLNAAQASLKQTVADQEQRIAEAMAELRARSVELSSIQTPLIRIAPGVLVVPLVGAWDDTRADAFTQSLLRGVERQRARVAVLDLTGLAAMSDGVARMVLRVVRGARLLGCRCVLVGVQPESAQALVSLGVDLAHVEIGADLADGVALSLNGERRADNNRG
jgi:anti-anti-sigma regulatory factor